MKFQCIFSPIRQNAEILGGQNYYVLCAYLIDKGSKSATVKSYVSAIKKVLLQDKYEWQDSILVITSLVKACKIKDDVIGYRLSITKGLLEIMMFELECIYINMPYLCILYKAIFCLGYYGLMRVGELTHSQHTVKAANIHKGTNKDKILIILYSSKTHSKESYPQEIKITSVRQSKLLVKGKSTFFCPFQIIRNYVGIRGNYVDIMENFFVFRDGSPVKPIHLRKVLRRCIANVNLDPLLYDCHSFRIGHSCDLV